LWRTGKTARHKTVLGDICVGTPTCRSRLAGDDGSESTTAFPDKLQAFIHPQDRVYGGLAPDTDKYLTLIEFLSTPSGCNFSLSRYNGAARRQAGVVMVTPSVPPQRLPVNLVRSGRKQPQREHCVPGCGWWGCLHNGPIETPPLKISVKAPDQVSVSFSCA